MSSCTFYRGKCLFLNGKEDGCKSCPIVKPIKKVKEKPRRDSKRIERQGSGFLLKTDYRMIMIIESAMKTMTEQFYIAQIRVLSVWAGIIHQHAVGQIFTMKLLMV